MTAFLGGAWLWIENDMREPGLGIDRTQVPVGALDYLERGGVRGRLFNTFQFGGYVSWRGRSPFVDGRLALPGELLDKAMFAQVVPSAWHHLETSYHIDHAILAYPALDNNSMAKIAPDGTGRFRSPTGPWSTGTTPPSSTSNGNRSMLPSSNGTSTSTSCPGTTWSS